MPISVVIADDHALTLNGTCALVESMNGFDVAGVAQNGIEAISQIKRLTPNCAVLDLVMPGATGLEVLIEARRWSPDTKIAIVTGSPSVQSLQQLAAAGATGIFFKTGPVEEFRDGLRDVAAGRKTTGVGVKQYLEHEGGGESLSGREIEVLQCIARGLSNNGIAQRLSISPKTVDNHRTNLMRKLGVHSTATLLVHALRNGLVEL